MLMRAVLPTELARGQTVIVFARWLLVLVGLLVAIWNPDALPLLRVEIGVILLVAIANFVMHAQLLRRRPTIEGVAYAASLGDLLVISLLCGVQGGFHSNLFVFYFPAVLAIGVAFPTRPAAGLSCIAVCLALMVGFIGAPNDLDLVLRGLGIATVAVIGNAYWRLHRSRIPRQGSTAAQEAAQDLFWGQIATLGARWAIIIGGAALVLSRAASASELAVGILPVVVLLVANFYLHGRYLMERPANAVLTLAACGLDLLLVAALFLNWRGTGALENPTVVFLYPLVFGVGLVFSPRLSWAFTSLALVVYTVLVVPPGLDGAGDLKVLVVRLVTLAAMGGLGSLYWRIVRRESRSLTLHEANSDAALAWQPASTG